MNCGLKPWTIMFVYLLFGSSSWSPFRGGFLEQSVSRLIHFRNTWLFWNHGVLESRCSGIMLFSNHDVLESRPRRAGQGKALASLQDAQSASHKVKAASHQDPNRPVPNHLADAVDGVLNRWQHVDFRARLKTVPCVGKDVLGLKGCQGLGIDVAVDKV